MYVNQPGVSEGLSSGFIPKVYFGGEINARLSDLGTSQTLGAEKYLIQQGSYLLLTVQDYPANVKRAAVALFIKIVQQIKNWS